MRGKRLVMFMNSYTQGISGGDGGLLLVYHTHIGALLPPD